MSSPKRNPTTQDVARAAGVNQSTVSRALRNDRQVSAETARRIQTVALALGYRPDPYLTAYTARVRAYRRKPRPASILLLGCTRTFASGPDLYALGARERAEELGYVTEFFDYARSGLPVDRVGAILRARGTDGVLILPVDADVSLEGVDLSGVAASTVDLTLHDPQLHRAVPDYFGHMRLALAEVERAGFRRVALCDSIEEHQRFDATWLGAFLAWQHRLPPDRRLPPYTTQDFAPRDFLAWHAQWLPDVIVSNDYCYAEWVLERGLRIPQDFAFAALGIVAEHPRCPGIDQRPHAVGRHAIDLIVEQLHQNQRGVPSERKTVLVPGRWQGGPWRFERKLAAIPPGMQRHR